MSDDIERFLADVGHDLQPYLQHAIDRIPDVRSLKEGVVFQALGGGKRVRAALCATVCEIFDGSYQEALAFAAAIEHLQNFTLIHDDIADGDEARRGRESAWKRFGVAHAINIGDAFIPLSSLAILESDYAAELKLRLMTTISNYALVVAEGQSLDIALRDDDAPTVPAYMDCTAKKTGGFFAMATVGGAIIGGAEAHHVAALDAFAMQAGVAFQIKDDILDLTGGKGRTLGSDVLEGKRTLLVAYALERAAAPQAARLIEILNRPRHETPHGDVRWVLELYAATRARERAQETAEETLDRAICRLDGLPETPAKYRFLRLSHYLTRRQR